MTVSDEVIEKYLSISINGGGTYHPEKNQIAFVSDRSGVYQIYTKNLETGEEVQISKGEDRATNPYYLSNGDLLYSTDFGGDERFQLMIYREEDDETFRLTTFLEAKHRFEFATDNAVYVSANLLDNQRFDVFRYSFPLSAEMDEELLMKGEPFIPVSPSVVNEDETKLVVSKIKSNLSNDLILYDLKDGQQHALTEDIFGNHNARFSAVGFINESTLLVGSDKGREFLSLALFDINSGSLTFLEKDQWDTGRTLILDNLSPTKLIYSKNVEGSSQLYLADFDESKLSNVEEVALPFDMGILSSGDTRTFTRSFVTDTNQSKLLLTYSSPTNITNIYEVDLKDHQLQEITTIESFNGTKFLGYTLEKFSSFDGLEVPYYVMRPEGDGPFPTVFVIHGGPESQSRTGFSNKLQLLASQGYMLIVPNIRGSRGYGRSYLALDDIEKRLDSIKDIAALAKYLKENNDDVDPNQLVIYGGSYGGFAVLSSIAEFPDLFDMAVDIVGISNFVTFLENTADWRRRLREVEYGFLDKHREFLEEISPSNKVDQIKTPTLIIQGDNDERVPLSESLQMYKQLQENGVETKLIRFEDEGHGVVKRKNQIIQYQEIFKFINNHL